MHDHHLIYYAYLSSTLDTFSSNIPLPWNNVPFTIPYCSPIYQMQAHYSHKILSMPTAFCHLHISDALILKQTQSLGQEKDWDLHLHLLCLYIFYTLPRIIPFAGKMYHSQTFLQYYLPNTSASSILQPSYIRCIDPVADLESWLRKGQRCTALQVDKHIHVLFVKVYCTRYKLFMSLQYYVPIIDTLSM